MQLSVILIISEDEGAIISIKNTELKMSAKEMKKIRKINYELNKL